MMPDLLYHLDYVLNRCWWKRTCRCWCTSSKAHACQC